MTSNVSDSKNKLIAIAATVTLIIVAVIILIILKISGFFAGEKLPEPDWSWPNIESQVLNPALTVDSEQIEMLEQRLLKLNLTDFGLVQWYQLPLRSEEKAAERSNTLSASDQILYGRYLAEQNRMEEFLAWKNVFESVFVDETNIVSEIKIDGSEIIFSSEEKLWGNSLAYTGVLMIAYGRTPSVNLWQEIEKWSETLLETFAGDELPADLMVAVPTAAPAPDPAATPTPIPVVTPTPEAAPVHGLHKLSSFDLLTIKQLIEVDEGWGRIYESWRMTVSGGLISQQMPLYAIGVWPDGEGYLNFTTDSGAVDCEESMKTANNLAAAGVIDNQALYWINDQLLNNFALYSNYNIIQGHAMSDQESIASYAYAALIARTTNDSTLYNSAVNKLIWHTATSERSDAYGAIFSEDATGIIRVPTKENLLALIAYD